MNSNNVDKNKITFLASISNGFNQYSSKISWLIFFLVSVFSSSGWIEIFGISFKKIESI